MSAKIALTILGSTGSIGCSTLDVIDRHDSEFRVFALTAHSNVQKLFQQCLKYKPVYAVIDEKFVDQLKELCLKAHLDTEILSGESALIEVAEHSKVSVVMAAIVGAAGLLPTLAAVKASKKVLLANKEALVMSGQLFMEAVSEHDALLLPIDSEHNAIFQCLPSHLQRSPKLGNEQSIRKVILTASGGPFRTFSFQQLTSVTPQQACKHPNWSMGQKISIDSASLMNKGLELIEACWLFDINPEMIDVVIHPQSIIHSMVQYEDGSVMAQMGNPDMRTPIAYALGWPNRKSSGVSPLNLVLESPLSFEEPDIERFPCLRLAREAFMMGGTSTAVLNAANEIAVNAFLMEQISFTEIPTVIEAVMLGCRAFTPSTIQDVLDADQQARLYAQQWIDDKTSIHSEKLTSMDGV